MSKMFALKMAKKIFSLILFLQPSFVDSACASRLSEFVVYKASAKHAKNPYALKAFIYFAYLA
jgi:hypothetical protein